MAQKSPIKLWRVRKILNSKHGISQYCVYCLICLHKMLSVAHHSPKVLKGAHRSFSYLFLYIYMNAQIAYVHSERHRFHTCCAPPSQSCEYMTQCDCNLRYLAFIKLNLYFLEFRASKVLLFTVYTHSIILNNHSVYQCSSSYSCTHSDPSFG
jgi:hypothetical protein